MRDLTGTQQAGFDEFNATKHMEGEGEAPKIHTLIVKDDPEELDALPEWMDGNDLISCENEAPEILIAGPDGGEDGAILRRGSKLVVGGSSKGSWPTSSRACRVGPPTVRPNSAPCAASVSCSFAMGTWRTETPALTASAATVPAA